MFTKADYFILLAALLSFVLSVALWFGTGLEQNKDAGLFVGIWVPSILSAGRYFRSPRGGK